MSRHVSLDRRSFLQGAALSGAGLAALGLAGCAQPAAKDLAGTGSAGAESSTSSSGELIAQATLNPQEEFKQATTNFETLLSPWKMGNLELKNRILKSSAGSACYLAGLTDELFEYYANIARGGTSFIWLENVNDLIPPFETADKEQAARDFLVRLIAECEANGCYVGGRFSTGMNIPPLEEITVEELHALEDEAVERALWFKSVGAKAYEIHSSSNGVGAKLMRRVTNTRTDEYGNSSLENRARFTVECIQKVKAACGDDFPIEVMMHGIEEKDNIPNNPVLSTLDKNVTPTFNLANTLEESIAFAKMFEDAGADALQLRMGMLDAHSAQCAPELYFILNGLEGATGFSTQFDFKRHWQGMINAKMSGAGMLLDVAAKYKEVVSIPVGIVGYSDPAIAPDLFEQALVDGKVDFYLLNRPLTVDMEYVNKLAEGRRDEIAPCTRCVHCHIGSNEANAKEGYCRVNALTHRVMREGGPTTYELPPAETQKNVVVVGGGPAGMEAARIAASRGHHVTLYEKNNSLGGLLSFAEMVKGPHENLSELIAYLERQLELTGVTVELGTEVDADFINQLNADAVVLATGGARREFDAANDGSVTIVDFDAFMSGDEGERVVIWGGNAQAWDAALWLTVRGKSVQLVTEAPNEELDCQQSQHAQRWMTTALYALGVRAWPNATISEVKNGSVVIEASDGLTHELTCDTLIVGAEMDANKSLFNNMTISEKYAVGDCENPFNIALAIRGGNDVGRAL